ncbi:MAG: type IX secretion system sortase PorU [Flammeovirgaceae bacterium]|nr:MAG: type IX secretion system sortase PorU [Flammeovirgaceae bacterium]
MATVVALVAVCVSASGQSSVLHTGNWYKVAVKQNGVYRIDLNLFKKMGFDPKTDPRKIRIYGNGGGMLPQANSTPRPTDLTELAIYIQGEEDGNFNSQDFILFYAEGPDKVSFSQQEEIFFYEKNLYASQNFYFITVGTTNGKRIQTASDAGSGFPVVSTFENFVYHELDQHNELKSGRAWFGERFDLSTELIHSFSLPDIIPDTPIKIVSDVMAQSFDNTSFSLFLNGTQIGQQTIAAIPNIQYGIKGRQKRDTLIINSTAVSAPSTTKQELRYQYNKSTSTRSIGYLNFCLLQATQQLKLQGQQTLFRSLASLQQPVSRYSIGQATASSRIWNITDPLSPVLQVAVFQSGTISFAAPSVNLQNYIVFQPNAPAPELIGKVTNQNLRGQSTPNLIIVTHPDFKNEAQRLANHRMAVTGWTAQVATTTEIYNEFSSGRQDVTAIRDFVKHLYDKAPGALRALLLFGKGSYDYKNILGNNRNFVVTYESRNSLHPLQTYSSDDYFAFLENHEGEWAEDPPVNHSMDIGVGRLPVKTLSEAKTVVDKIIAYDTDTKLAGPWRKNIVFIADDGDFNIHQSQADQLAEEIEANQAFFNPHKIYLDAFPQPAGASGQTSPETRTAIEKAFYDGALIINYTGHGGERQWAQERIFDDLVIVSLQNKRLPLLLTATCEFGRQDDPIFLSGGELCILQKNGGAIALVTTARPVSSSTNFALNQAFYEALFQKNDNAYTELGDIFRRTKNSSHSGVSNRNFSLIGDPSLHLAMPEFGIEADEIKTQAGSDTLSALSLVTITGKITDHTHTVNTSFNGILHATLLDKETSFQTLGDENPVFSYTQWFNALYRGQAQIENGTFSMELLMPKNIVYSVGTGKLSLYAYHEEQLTDASGFSKAFKIGLSEPTPPTDNTPPEIRLFIGDTTFIEGGIVPTPARLIARLSDDSGINISAYGIGNSLVATIDDNQTFILNNYYIADINNFRKGTIEFTLPPLLPGTHNLTLKAWDAYNNPAQASINFSVGGEGLVIESFGNYPNPFTESTKLYLTHNRSGDDLEGVLGLYDYTGREVHRINFFVPESTYQVTLAEFFRTEEPLKYLKAGLYYARISLRSITNGSKNERVTKLIIAN